MKIEVNQKKTKIGWLWNIIRHGLFLHGLSNRLSKVGLDIVPYYWVQEGLFMDEPPKIKGVSSEYKLKTLDLKGIEHAGSKIAERNRKDMVEGFKKGQIYLGLTHLDDIAACMAIELKGFTLNDKAYELKQNEAYLLNMWTFSNYRGKNLAPYLRYQSYLMLNEMGRNNIYSLSALFNKSTLKFKSKLGAKNLKLFATVNLFNRYRGLFILKDYRRQKGKKEEQSTFI